MPTKKTISKRKLESIGSEPVLSGKKIRLNGKLGSAGKSNCRKSTNGDVSMVFEATQNGKSTSNDQTNQSPQPISNGKSPKASLNGVGLSKTKVKPKPTNNTSASSDKTKKPNRASASKPNSASTQKALDQTKLNSSLEGTKGTKKLIGRPIGSNGSDRLLSTRRQENSQTDKKTKTSKKVGNGLASDINSDTNSKTLNSKNGKAIGRPKQSNGLANGKRLIAGVSTNPKNAKRQQVGGAKT